MVVIVVLGVSYLIYSKLFISVIFKYKVKFFLAQRQVRFHIYTKVPYLYQSQSRRQIFASLGRKWQGIGNVDKTFASFISAFAFVSVDKHLQCNFSAFAILVGRSRKMTEMKIFVICLQFLANSE